MAREATADASPALIAAITTEHFAMQSAMSTASSEAAARASIYMYSLSGSLVALGVSSQSGPALMPFIASVFPAVILLGLFTIARLVDISLDHLQARTTVAEIHAWYATLGPAAARQFGRRPDQAAEAESIPALRLGPVVGGLTTIASMVAAINGIVTGAAIALAVIHLLRAPPLVGVAAGAIAATAVVAGFYAYQSFRLHDALARMTAP